MTTENHPVTAPQRFSDYMVRALIVSSQELRGVLNTNESTYLRLAPWSHSDARGCFLYSCVDEVMRVASAIIRWRELAAPSASESDQSRAIDEDSVARTTIGAIQTEQSLWLRKLLECAVDLICFQDTNDDSYYRHYLLVRQLDRRLNYARELEEYFGQDSANIAHGNQRIVDRIRELERSLDANQYWYLKEKRDLAAKPKPPLLSSFGARLKAALKHASTLERLLLGLTYRVYGVTSENIHFNVGETHSSIGNADVLRKADYCGLLAARILIRAYRLAGLEPRADMVKQMHRVLESDGLGKEILSLSTAPIAEPGDFVAALGGLAELVDVKSSSFGYVMYRVAYLADSPIDGVDDEWVVPEYVQRLFSRRLLLLRIGEMLANSGVDLQTVDETTVKESLRASAVQLWKEGHRDLVDPDAAASAAGGGT